MFVVKKLEQNPILTPNKDHYWEEFATFNLSPIKYKGKTYGLYRAISAIDILQNQNQISTIGIGESEDGIHFTNRVPFITPKEEWEKCGCEDPRVTYFEGKFYIFYTALSEFPFNSKGIKVAVAISSNLEKVEERHLVTPFNAKSMTLFPERINGKIVVIFSYHTDSLPIKTVFATLDKIEDLWREEFWQKWEKNVEENTINFKRESYDHMEIGSPPVKTKYGWLLVYSYIQNHLQSFNNLDKIFGVEVALLDLKDPKKIIGRTEGPIIVPEESYELSSNLGNIIFPTGAIIEKSAKGLFYKEEDVLNIYYSVIDSTVCLARANLTDLIFSIHPKYKDRFHFKRFSKNPILEPILKNNWEAQATFNPGVLLLNGKIHLIYRAMSLDNVSTFGYAMTKNGTDIVERLPLPIYVPREDFESKKNEEKNSGCEDPRITKIGDDIYMCYTAYDGINSPRVAISSIKEKDFLSHNWNWEKPFLITPEGFDDKDACIFPEKFPLGYFIIHRVGNEICGDYLSTLDFQHEKVKKCLRIIGPRMNTWDSWKVGISATPVKTKYGWLLLYHGVSKSHNTYRVGCVLLDLKDPTLVLARSSEPIFEPEEPYEKKGIVNNVVFPCGVVVRGELLYIYYGGGDKVVGVATVELDIVLNSLIHGMNL